MAGRCGIRLGLEMKKGILTGETWRRNAEKSFTQMDKNGNMSNGVWIEMIQGYRAVVKKTSEEVRRGETKSALEKERKNNNLAM